MKLDHLITREEGDVKPWIQVDLCRFWVGWAHIHWPTVNSHNLRYGHLNALYASWYLNVICSRKGQKFLALIRTDVLLTQEQKILCQV